MKAKAGPVVPPNAGGGRSRRYARGAKTFVRSAPR